MRTIYKYAIPQVARFCINAPLLGLTPVHVAVQHGQPCMWFQVDTGLLPRPRWFLVCGTGEPLPESGVGQHVGTFMMRDGMFVFHVFALTPPPDDECWQQP